MCFQNKRRGGKSLNVRLGIGAIGGATVHLHGRGLPLLFSVGLPFSHAFRRTDEIRLVDVEGMRLDVKLAFVRGGTRGDMMGKAGGRVGHGRI